MRKISQLLDKFRHNRTGFTVLIVFMILILSLFTRLSLLIISVPNLDQSFYTYPYILFTGLFYDVVNASYFILPFVVYQWFVPYHIYKQKWHKYLLLFLFFLVTAILLLNAVGEWFFWDEFTTRYNFIAVDYLIYTTEVIGNIRQSYPIEWIIAALLVIAFSVTFIYRKYLTDVASAGERFRKRTRSSLLLLFFPVFSYFIVNSKLHMLSPNQFANDLAANGMYELFSAFRNNTLSYERFYSTNDIDASYRTVKLLLSSNEGQLVNTNTKDISRIINSSKPASNINVVLISVESLSAEFLGAYGNQQHLTPELDTLANNGLIFTNLYATGARTVRGLEALSLSVPPSPGQSIVRRPDNENLFSLGKVLSQKGYDTKFIYGGYSYFDNMGYFFSNNHYEVVDRKAIKDEDIDYENIWGVADEDLYDLTLSQLDSSYTSGKPFFAHLMTTSNHRPFTYPEGRIDIPSGDSREGAVKYTDYAIGRFIKMASLKKWFDNTLFIIVADHCASSAGKTELPFNKYHIPLIMYAPKLVVKGKMEKLMSQIDIPPTLLGMMNISYQSDFFGFNIYKVKEGDERAFISTYEKLGYIKHNKMIVLSPNKKNECYSLNFTDGAMVKTAIDKTLLQEAIAWYYTSSYNYEHGFMQNK